MYSNGVVIEGRDYGRISNIAHRLSFPSEKIDGFITSAEEFVLPQEAAVIAVQAGQLPEIPEQLTPEQLWPLMEMESTC